MLSAEFQPYYDLLMKNIAARERCGGASTATIEACFKSSLEQWRVVQRRVRQHGFGSVKGEIYFFREVKPAFGAWIEYYKLRYHAALFAPLEDWGDTGHFWKREQRKMEKFFESNRDFCCYIESGDASRDEDLFRRNGEEEAMEGELTCRGDKVMTMIRAYQLYEKYIQFILVEPLPANA